MTRLSTKIKEQKLSKYEKKTFFSVFLINWTVCIYFVTFIFYLLESIMNVSTSRAF